MCKLSTSLSVILMAVALSGCSSNVIVDYDKAINFSTIKTYTLLPKSVKSTEDTRLDSPLVDKRIINAIEQNMLAKGFNKQAASADIQLTYRVDVKQEIVSDSSGVSMMFGIGGNRSALGLGYSVPTADVKSHDLGVLTIDFISVKTGQLVWRGTSSRRLYDAGTPESSEKLINSIVQEILDSYPPR
jgi:PBP1b-binding outer membrane lipoprotein LpoB